MTESIVLKATKRQTHGKRASRQLRKEGLVPVIIYGHKLEPVSVAVSYHDLALEIQHHHRLLEIQIDGKQDKFLIKEVQHDHLGDKIVHLDLARVDLNERVTVEVAVELRGVPAGVALGAVMEQVNAEIEIECVVISIPENIRASVTHLQVGDILLAGQIALPAGITLVSDPDMVIATVKVMAEEVEQPLAVDGDAKEPEVIVREKKTDDTEDDEKK